MAQKRSSYPREVELWVIAVVAVVFALLRLGRAIPPPFVGTAEAAACPIVDGGAGDDDASANGVVTISGSKTFTAITGTYDCTATPFLITSTGTLVLAGNTATGQIAAVNFGTLTVDSGGKISADAQGCAAQVNYYGAGPNGSNVCVSNNSGSLNTYSGGSANTAGAGGGHAGPGGTASAGTGVAGATYDSATVPSLFGSSGGGANGSVGGATGGGVVKIGVTGTLTLNGTISANGNSGVPDTSGRATGGGSGGSIYVTANAMIGASGLIQAKGGNGGASTAFGGGGGGGRVAVYVAGGTYTFNATNLDVAGGAGGGGSATAGTKGTVFVKNTATNAVTIYHGFTFDNTSYFVSSWTEDTSATNQNCDSGAVTPSIHATGAIAFAGTLNCTTSVTSFTLDSPTTLSLANSSTLSVNGGVFLSAGSTFSMGTGVTVTNTRTNTDIEFNVPDGNSQTWDSLTVNVPAEGEFITDDAFALTLQNGTAINGSVRWTALTALTQNSGTSINANGRGCVGTANYSSAPNGSNVCATDSGVAVYGPGAGGAGHGGSGGAGSTSAARGTYDSAIAPVLFGASGGGGNSSPTGANGGGLVRIVVTGAATLNGTISADGANGTISGANAGGGGAGGAINITTGAMNGTTGTFSAKGGNGADSTNDGGGGGGGRISVSHAGGTFAFDATDFAVTGGTVTGTATAGTKGTVYVKDTATNAVNVYHGFSFDNTNHFVSSWTVDPSTTNQYCEPSAVTPTIHTTGAITLAGTLNCGSAITSFTADAATTLTVANSTSITINGGIFFTAGTSLSMGTGVTISNTRTNYDIEFNIGAGSSTTWDSLTVNVAPEGEFITDDAFALTLQNGTAINGSVRWSNLTSLTQNSGTSINANAKGCQPTTNYSSVPNSSNVCATDSSVAVYGSGAGGGGHGGNGGAGSTSPARGTSDSAIAPVLFGMSGGSTNQGLSNGGAGGGVVRIGVTGTFVHNGTISVDGGNGAVNGTSAAAGGAGGSIYVTAGTLNGTTGTYSAKGGNGADSTNDGGGGGGGRVSVSHGGGTFSFDSTDFDVSGGTATGAATAGAKGTVYVKNTATNAVSIYHGFTFDDVDFFVSSWTVDSSATNQYCNTALGTSATPSVHATGAISFAGSFNCATSISTFTLDAGTTLSFANSASLIVNGSPLYSAGTSFSMGTGVTVTDTKSDSNIEFNVPAGNTQTWDSLTVNVPAEGEFITDDAFALTLQNGTAINGSVRWSNLTSLTQNSGTSINANAKGCQPTTNYSSVPNSSNVCATDSSVAVYGAGAGGGGHGGAGGAGSTSPGRGTNDSAAAPVLFGMSGGSTNQGLSNGGAGGGVVRIGVTGTFTHNGTISADGGNGAVNGTSAAAGGAGGSVYVTAATYTCATGTFSAKGGNGADSTNDGGGGGGGRFSVEYGSDTSGGGCPLSGLTAASVTTGGTATGAATAGSNGSLNLTSPVPTPGACPFVDNDAGDNDPTVGVYEWNANQTIAANTTTYDCTSPATFHIVAGRTITLDGNSATGAIAAVNFTNLTIDATGKLSADGKGCVGGTNHVKIPNGSNVCVDHSGTTWGTGSSGGGHGGEGGKGSVSTTPGSTYDSAMNPVMFGSSGAGTNAGTNGVNGGGVVKVTVSGTLTNNGTISANGNNGVVSGASGLGGGSGGSVYVTAGSVNGTTGVFEAKGGNGADSTNDGGGGGGGRIAVYYDSAGSTFGFSATNLVVTGGTAPAGSAVAGTKGTAFIDDDNGTVGALIDDAVTIYHGFTFTDSDLAFNSWTVDASATNQYCDANIASTATPSVSATAIALNGTLNCTQTITSMSFSSTGGFSFANGMSFTANAALSFAGGTSFTMGTGVTVTQNKTNADIDFDIPDGDNQTWSGLTVNGPAEGDLTVDDVIAITLSSGTALNASLRFTNLTAFTEDSGTSINANGKGCAGGPNHVKIPNSSNVCVDHGGTTWGTGSSGGGHGGEGGRGSVSTTPGSTYDSATAPALYGSAGGGTNAGTNGVNGGGLVQIAASGAVALNGTISANGLSGTVAGANGTGGGAGGSIYVYTAGALSGSIASFAAKGGNGADSTNDGGGGGGGRISLVYGSTGLTLASGLFDVSGGTAPTGTAVAGAKGTVFADDMAGTPNGDGDDAIRIFHGFTFPDTDFSVSSWTVDASATNVYCDTVSSTPSVSAITINLDGATNCTVAISSLTYSASTTLTLAAGASTSVNGAQTLAAGTTLTVGNGSTVASAGRLSLSAAGSFVMGSSVTVTDTGTNTDIDFDIPDGNDQNWSGLTVNGPAEGDFTVDDVIAITLSSGTALNANVRFTDLTAFTQSSGTSISANGKGCAGGPNHVQIPNGSNVCGNHGGTTYGLGASGGGHGGEGGRGSVATTNGSTYDSASAPVLYGSSGGGTNAGTSGPNGGGIVRINASGTVILDGTITVNGSNGTVAGANATGGGSGGSIYVSTIGALTGSIASLSAKGGNGADSTNDGGGGGGGRISLVYGSTGLTLASGLFDVSGGTAPTGTAVAGAKGTVFTDETGTNQFAYNDDTIHVYHGFTYTDYDWVVASWIIDPTASQSCDTTMSTGATPSVTATNAITFNGSLNCSPTITSFVWSSSGGFTTSASTTMTIIGALTLTTSGPLSLGNSSSLTSSGTMSISAGTTFSVGTGVTVTDNTTNTDIDFNIPAGNDQTWSGLTVNAPSEGDLTVDDAVAITFSSGTTVNGNVRFTNLTAFTQDAGTSINANGKGCAGGANYTIVPNSSNVCNGTNGTYGPGAAGGGHGGVAGAGTNVQGGAVGGTYDSATVPVLYGSSGGGTNAGTNGPNGGGIVRINASGTVTLNGTVTANGASGVAAGANATGGAAGGSIYVSTTGSLTGSIASFSAKGGDGGNGSTYKGGGGGGGRVSLVYGTTTYALAAGLFDVAGGAATSAGVAGTKGTVYVDDTMNTSASMTDDVIRIYHGFTFADTDFSVAQWLTDSGATNQYCDTTLGSGATPSVTTSSSITFDGVLNCNQGTTITSFTWTPTGGFTAAAGSSMTVRGAIVINPPSGPLAVGAGATVAANIGGNTGGALTLNASSSSLNIGNSAVLKSYGAMLLSASTTFTMGTGVTVTDDAVNTDIDFNVPVGNDQTWSGLTVTTPSEGDLKVDDAVAITFSSGTTVNGNVRFTNLTAFTQDAGTSINANGKGCTGGGNYTIVPNSSNVCNGTNSTYGPGASGGGHGGAGGMGTNVQGGAAGGTYDSATVPVLYGASGGGTNISTNGPNGGGLVRINASGTVTLNGAITANGLSGVAAGANATGGAAGGSIYVTAATLAGTPSATLSAKGGDGGTGSTYKGGGGGGGRMAFVYSSATMGISSAAFDVAGGAATSAAVAGTKGTVFVNNTVANTVTIYHGFTYADTDFNVTAWTIDPSATNQYCDTTLGSGATPSVTSAGAINFSNTLSCPGAITSFTWSSPSGITLAASSSMNVNGALTLTSSSGSLSVGNSSTLTSSGAMSLSAATTFAFGTGVTVTDNTTNTNIDFNIPAGNDQTWDSLTVNVPNEGDLTVNDAVAITMQNGATINGNVVWTNLTNVTLNAGTSINANYKGCVGGGNYTIQPNGSNVCNTSVATYGLGAGGGGHGGTGGNGTTASGGGTYDSAAAPVLYGSSGGGTNAGTNGPNGGGLVKIVASGTFTHDGAITANGNNGVAAGANATGGAAGGSINISTSTYVCTTGTFSALGGNGGTGSTNKGGGGGGGRVAISYNTDSSGACPLSGLTAAGVAPGGTATAAATAGATGTLTLNAGNPVPAISTLSPSSRAVGSGIFTLTVNGSNFVAGSIVQWNGASRTTTYVSATQLTASIPASDQTAAGSFPVTVFNPTPAGGTSNAVNFDVTNPAPTTTSISPNNKNVGDGAFTLTVNGTNFVSSSVVQFAGSSRTTTFVNSTQLTAAIPASDMLVGGNFTITVLNAGPGGGTSNGQTFTVGNPIPTTTSISPTSKNQGDPAFTLTVNGTGFVSTSVVRFAGSDRTTTYVSSTQVTADIPASDLTTGGTFTITVFNPTPGGGTSNGQTFTVGNPIPTTTSITPTSKTTGDSTFTMTVNGTNFIASSVVRFNGSDRTTTFVNSSQVTASIPASDMTSAGTFTITVFNPTPGGGTSNGQTFTVNNPAPTTTSISPTSRTANSGTFTLTVNGTGFVSASVVRFAGSDRTTSFVNSTQVTASIPASDIVASGSYLITVFNASPGGGESNAQTFSVTNPVPTTTSLTPDYADPGSSGFTLTVNGTNFIASSVVRFNGSDRTTTYVSSTQLTAAILTADLVTAGTYPITVNNPSPGGGTSNATNFIVGNPVPVTTSISPASKTVGDPGFTLTVNGSDFITSSVVKFNGSSRTTTYVSSTQLTASIPASDMVSAGTFSITVFNPTPVGGTSNGQTFTVNNPVPTTTSISPTSKNVGDLGFTLTVNGTNFLSSSVVRFNGSDRTTTFVNSTQVTASIPSSDLTSAATVSIVVFNPSPGGGASNSQTFTVTNYVPTTSSIAPTAKAPGSATFTLTVNGNNFVSGSVVRFNGSDRTTTFIAATQLTASIPASDLVTPGVYPITVFSPTPGGGVSNPQSFTVGDVFSSTTTSNSVTLSRLSVNAVATVTIGFTLSDTLSSILTVTFPAGFTVDSAATPGASSACLSGFGFTANTLTAVKTNCTGPIVLGGATVTNPPTPGVYTITWVNDSPGSATVIIVSNDSFTVTAAIDPVLTFNVGSQTAACDGTFSGAGGSVPLGILSTSSVKTSDVSSVPHICTRLTTNSESGAVVSVESANAALKSASNPSHVIASSTATLVAGTAGYGLCTGSSVGDTGTDTVVPAGAPPAAVAPFNGSCSTSAHGVGGLTTSPQTVWSVSGPSQNAFARLFVKAAISPSTVAHNDYADILTFIATGTY